MNNSRLVLFEIPDYLKDKFGDSMSDIVPYNPSNKTDGDEYRDYTRFLDILDDMDQIVDGAANSDLFQSISDPEQRKLYARIIVLHNLTLLLQKTIEKMKSKQSGGKQSLSYSSIEEENNMNRILNASGLINDLSQLNDSRPGADLTQPDPFSASSPTTGIKVNTGIQESIFPIRGGARACKKRMNKKVKGGADDKTNEITHSDLQANREINRILNANTLISDLNKLNKNRPYVDTSFPDPFSGSSAFAASISSNLGVTNAVLPQLGGKKKSNKNKF